MERTIKVILIILLFIVSMSVSTYAVPAKMPGYASTSRALFLEHYLQANGTVINGTAPFRNVNFPTYWYNANTKTLNGKIDFAVNDSLVMIFGDVLTLNGNWGAGTGNKLYGVYRLPVNADQAYVYGIDMAGNVAMRVGQKNVILNPDQSFMYSHNETVNDRGAIVEVMYNDTYVNHGFIDKGSISGSLVSR